MKLKKTLIIALFLLCLIMIGAVNASENTTKDIVSSDVNDDTITTAEDTGGETSAIDNSIETKKASNDGAEVISEGEESDPTSFAALRQKINDAPEGSTIELDTDYTYTGTSEYDNAIRISKSITIKGNGKTIDAKGKTRIFYIESNYQNETQITIDNLRLINGYTTSYGGAIYLEGYSTENNLKLTITNSQFTNNIANCGGAIYISNSNLTITNCNFTNNIANGHDGGGAIHTYYAMNDDYYGVSKVDPELRITNCNFINNIAKYDGGAINNHGKPLTITNCNFIKNTAKCNGGAIRGWRLTITNSNFTQNKATGETSGEYIGCGGAIYAGGTITNCIFTNNTALSGGAIRGSETITNTQFKQNTANYGGAIHSGNLTITQSIFTDNNAKEGDGILLNNEGDPANAKIIKSIFENDKIKCNNADNVELIETNVEIIGKNEVNPNNGNTKPTNGDSSTTNKATTDSSTKVTQKTIKITAPKKTFKRKVKTKKYTVTVKSGSKTIKGLKLTLKIKGKKYSATTNNKGKATFKIKKLTKKGKYTATITFSGDKTYKGTSKKVKITIK